MDVTVSSLKVVQDLPVLYQVEAFSPSRRHGACGMNTGLRAYAGNGQPRLQQSPPRLSPPVRCRALTAHAYEALPFALAAHYR